MKRPRTAHSQHAPAAAAELEVAETVGRLMHFWGFKRPMGRVWTVLYLSPEPITAASLGELLAMSAGAISMTLTSLERWGCIARTSIPGERRDYFVAEADVWKMVQRVLRERELLLVREFGEALRSAERAAEASWSGPFHRESEEARAWAYRKARLAKLHELSHVGETLLTALVAGSAVDPTTLIRSAARATSEPSLTTKPS